MGLHVAPLRTHREIGTFVVLGIVYFAAAKLGLKLSFVHPSAAPFWPPTGIALAAILLFGGGAWPGIFVGAFLANLTTDGTLWTSLGIATGNTLEALVGGWLVNRYANGRGAFNRPQDIFKFAALAAIVSPVVSPTIGVSGLALGGFAGWADYWPIWRIWWLGDAAGALIAAPLLLLWSSPPHPRWDARQLLERVLFLSALLAVSWIVFSGMFPFVYLTVPFLIWSACRFQQRETATVIALLALIAIRGTSMGVGPFIGATPDKSFLLLQAFMGIMVSVALPLASVVAERQQRQGAEARGRRAAERAADRIARLQAVTAALSQAATPEQIAEVIVDQGVRAMEAHAGAFYQTTGSGDSIEVVRAMGYPEKIPGAWQRQSATIPAWATDAVRTKAPVFLSDEVLLRRHPRSSAVGRASPGAARAAVPLIVSMQPIGVLVLNFAKARTFEGPDKELILAITRQCAQAFDRARLYETERVAHHRAELAADRTARLQAVTAALAEALTPARVAEVIVDQGVAALGAQAGAMSLLTEDGTTLELVRAVGYPDEFVARWQRTGPSTRISAVDAIRTREPVFLESRDALATRYSTISRPWPILPDHGARAILPLIGGQNVLGVLSFLFPEPRPFPPDERAFIQTLARQCAQALERARLHERDHHVAETLQRAFLPAGIPELPGIRIAAAYTPATTEALGGDWYDVFRLPDGRVALSVGDVVGHGLTAATVMGQVRQSIRAAALEGHSPFKVLQQASSVLRLTYEIEGMATAVFGILDPASLIFAYSSGGHPPPALATPDGQVTTLELGGLPLGVPDPNTPPVRVISIPPGSMLVLYTDGLIESTHNIEEGQAALTAAIHAELETPSENPARALFERLIPHGRSHDDVAILTVSVAPAATALFDLTVPAMPASAREIRLTVRSLASGLRLSPGRSADLEVAVGEAMNNAIEHAYRAGPGMIQARAHRDGDTLTVEVRDYGHWRSPRDEGRGHGLTLMRALVDGIDIDATARGTIVRLILSLSEATRATPNS
ncbi:MAG TPA: SpoIIE family protein phosphatase [bacterium]|nr:SpoIIE family protein phosphatase [bacterium]